jgi:hypothetical protein
MSTVYTCFPLARCSVPPHARVVHVTASAKCPCGCGEWLRVEVRDIRQVNILGQNGEPPYLVADVCVNDPRCLPFSVRLENLRHVQIYAAVETEEARQ